MSLESEKEEEFLRALPPLVRAAAVGDLERVCVLLAAGASASETDDVGWTALHAAAVRRYPQIVEALLAAGADPNVADSYGFTPLLNASGPGDAASVEALLHAGADVEVSDAHLGWRPLSRAAEWDNFEVLVLLLSAGADPNQDSPLIAAAEAGSLRCVRALVAHGADPAMRIEGHTASHYARRRNHHDIAAYLDNLAAGQS
ncbi:ankyrin repeat domain-containing protein [Microbacterium oxydans]|uniref:ankyrin repeat domain-containing protein n=1 Tax=Microbacterium oxydans TaxID=82380 RepID=UPI00226B2C7B|nr:ankyrin repeat domain-containing protein [Microbacterium oxydans]WAA64845.1 ankyrin repeat domain-containing protein [Microbacterium oxydans]